MTKNLCIIPARGGSKRIPRKNIKEFLGKPIIAYSINAAIESRLFNEIMVSTDDEETARIARQHGAKIPFMRSEKTADDFATLADVVDEVKQQYDKINKSFDVICLILPTAPLIQVSQIIKAYEQLSSNDIDSVRPILRYSYPIQRAVKKNDEELLEMFYPQYREARSQDLEPAYHDAGQFYWMRYGSGLRGKKKAGLELSEFEVQDIDTLEDWRIAELKYKLLFGN